VDFSLKEIKIKTKSVTSLLNKRIQAIPASKWLNDLYDGFH